MPDASVACGRAFAPSHVTGLVVPRTEARDPRARGSVGAGLVLSTGVIATATWRPGSRRSVALSSDRPASLEISEVVARRLLGARPGRLSVALTHPLPIGQGFGASAAGALATGLAVADALGLPPRKAVEVAHLADLFGGGGLGGVAAILGGGLEVRLRPGLPPHGRIVRRPRSDRLLVGTVGRPLRTGTVLRDPGHQRSFDAGETLLTRLGRRPTWDRFWDVSEAFTDEVDLAVPRLRDVLRGLRRRGSRAAQAMFGGSFFATLPSPAAARSVARWLRRSGATVWPVAVGSQGAHALGPPSPP